MVILMKKLCEICDKEFKTDNQDYIVIIAVENQREVIIIQENIKKLF